MLGAREAIGLSRLWSVCRVQGLKGCGECVEGRGLGMRGAVCVVGWWILSPLGFSILPACSGASRPAQALPACRFAVLRRLRSVRRVQGLKGRRGVCRGVVDFVSTWLLDFTGVLGRVKACAGFACLPLRGASQP